MSLKEKMAAALYAMGVRAPSTKPSRRVPPHITTRAVRLGCRRKHSSQPQSALLDTFCSMADTDDVVLRVKLLPYLAPKDAMRFALSCKSLACMFGSEILRQFIVTTQALSLGMRVHRSIGVLAFVDREMWKNNKHFIVVGPKTFVREKHWMIDGFVCFKEDHKMYGTTYRTMHGQAASKTFTRYRIATPVWVYVHVDRHISRLIREVVLPATGAVECLNELAP